MTLVSAEKTLSVRLSPGNFTPHCNTFIWQILVSDIVFLDKHLMTFEIILKSF